MEQTPLTSPQMIQMQIPTGMRLTWFHAMGTTITILLPADCGAEAASLVETLFTHWEKTLTRFDPTSALSQLNHHAGAPVVVAPLLCTVLATALAAAQATDGIYDPTLLPQIRQAGYDRSFELIPTHRPAEATMPSPGGGWREIQIDQASHRVSLPTNIAIDLGGIAKGMAVDAALQLLREHHVTAALVNAGGDLGVLGVPPTRDYWPVAVPGDAVIGLCRGAIATSGNTWRRWFTGTQLQHHLIDPRTGTPAQTGLATATVAAAQCVQAEIAAKVAYILGPEAGLAFLRQHDLDGVLIHDNGTSIATEDWRSGKFSPRPLL